MTNTPDVTVLGMEADGQLPSEAREVPDEADMILGWPRHLRGIRSIRPPTMQLNGLRTLIPTLRSFPSRYRVVVLATGDPLDHGIGEYLARRYPADRLTIVPARSSVQLALARLNRSRTETYVRSLHGRPLDNLRHALTRQPRTVVVFTDHRNSPRRILQFLWELGCREYGFHLFEHLGTDTERHHTARRPEDLPPDPDPLNLVVLTRSREPNHKPYPRPGIPDDELTGPDDSMITPHHQRMLNLGHLQLLGDETVWDIGAATGSISIEAARLHPDATFHAVEKRSDRLSILKANIQQFRTYNVIPHHGEAPEILDSLPDPDRVFLGGSGGRPGEIVDAVVGRLDPRGLILANFITFENANRTRRRLLEHGFHVDERLITVHHQGTIAGQYRRWEDAGVLQQLIATPKIR